ncbi:hypothetical protein IQ265_10645 [Nodosilinea sp. LEGE 06152]|uniref:hypothetical protein n=1 Tax=Nodosilinea sp. LEGE 06152 TaxID=2777966 RepID=UPI001880072F|nr:hypothetical protein [Nodosilinea sp. LEGE 06152]MBE9157276.1 hypothetical protein [Nodosilinea sp. LEGE 06152]
MSDGQHETALERRVALPEPDVSNITVLTESLPNEPVLPWHHFDSPWLDRDAEIASEESEAEVTLEASDESEPTEQLTLELEVLVAPLNDSASEESVA